MPNRILKESIWTSPNLNKVSPLAERHFYRLLPAADDFGCFEATPLVIKGKCYPLQPATRPAHIEAWQRQLEACSCLRFWESGGRLFAQFTAWDQHDDLLLHREPTTPCPPWLLKEGEFDPRLGTETLQAFSRISVALLELGDSASYRQICTSAKCSMSTLSRYRKYKEKEKRYGVLHRAIDATPEIELMKEKEKKNKPPNPLSGGVASNDLFPKFWAAYPKKRSMGKAEKAWLKINPDEQLLARILATIERAKKSEDWCKDAGQYIPHPATWLNAKGWEDEIRSETQSWVEKVRATK